MVHWLVHWTFTWIMDCYSC